MELHEELSQIAKELILKASRLDSPEIKVPIDHLIKEASRVGKSFSGSWLGYHSLIYYDSFHPPPGGAVFSIEWGLKDSFGINGTIGDWKEYGFDTVKDTIYRNAGYPDTAAASVASEDAKQCFKDYKPEILSILENSIREREEDDPFLKSMYDKVSKLHIEGIRQLVDTMAPKEQTMSRDSLATSKGSQIPPHISVLAKALALSLPGEKCKELAQLANKAGSHLKRKQQKAKKVEIIGTNVFIGHGQSKDWMELKDFIKERLKLPYDEFNRVPIAGVTNTERLSEMMESAAFAFLVMTGEDEQADGKVRARMNVVHEAGLFQGRLGFTRAIVVLEDGCEEFSNIQGLGQLRFPKNNISAIFEKVRQVLEREGII